jgi:hypothetical protein
LAPPLLIGAFGMAIGVALLGQVGDFPIALVLMAVAAGAALLLEIVATTLQQRIVPDAIRGRTFGIIETVGVTAYAVGSFVLPGSSPCRCWAVMPSTSRRYQRQSAVWRT